jgi:hypothetical protein
MRRTRTMTTADIPKVLIRDTRTERIVGEGYYFEYEAYTPYPMYDGDPPPPPPTVRCVVMAEPNDFGLAPNVRILRVTPPHEIVVKPTPAERTKQ